MEYNGIQNQEPLSNVTCWTDAAPIGGWKRDSETAVTVREKRQGSLGSEWLCGESVRILALFLIIFVAVVVISLTILWHIGCSLEAFECKDATCLSREKFCDGFVDCTDGEDEKESYCTIKGQKITLHKASVQVRWNSQQFCDLSGYPGSELSKQKEKISLTDFGYQTKNNFFDNSSLTMRKELQKRQEKTKLRNWKNEIGKMKGRSSPSCICSQHSVLKCFNLNEIPDKVVGKVTKLILEGKLESISPRALDKYTDLEQGLYLQKNHLSYLPNRVFQYQRKLQILFLYENRISNISEGAFFGLTRVEILHLHNNNLTTLKLTCFSPMPNLVELLLSFNSLTLDNEKFPKLPRLSILFLQRNHIRSVSDKLFYNLLNLETLSLQNNKISYIHPAAFDNLKRLAALDLSHNLLTSVSKIFYNLRSLKSLNLRGLQLDSSQPSDFQNLSSLEVVYFPRLRYCHFVEHVDHCEPRSDGITTKEDLVHSVTLRVSVWLMAVLTLTGNVAVILSRGISKGDDEILVLFIKNLAMADLLMGVYLCIVGIQDQRTRGSYSKHAIRWTSSLWCSLAGFLALVSSEASVFILAFMSLQRYLHLVRFTYNGELSKKFARRSLITIWLTSVVLALFPALWMSSFYGINSMCFPLHISEPYLEGWEFSAFVFLGLNSFCVTVIIASYVGLFINIQITRSETPLSKTEMSIALRFLFIVLTDCVCWLPILIFKIIALLGVPIPGQAYAWLVVLVLPVNSAINPVLYTFSTTHFIGNLKSAMKKFQPSWERKISAFSSSDTSCSSYRRSQGSCNSGSNQCANLYDDVKSLSRN